MAAALADAPDELEPLVRMKVRFRVSRSPTRAARTVAIGALEGEVATRGLRGIEWVIFEVKVREKRGLRRDSAFRGMGYLA